MSYLGGVLGEDEVTFCVDTNLLVEFMPLEQIPWAELVPNARTVRIIVPTRVAEEMDAHKKKSGRLRRRGIEFSNRARRIEDSADAQLVIRAEAPRVTVEFGPAFRRSQLDGDLFELDDADARIVAEVAAIARDAPATMLLCDDSKPIRLARHAGLLCVRPPETWRRVETADEKDVLIDELKREIGAAPKLVVRLPDAVDEKGTHLIEALPEHTDCDHCTTLIATAALSVDPKVSRARIAQKYGIGSDGGWGGAMGMHETWVTQTALRAYDSEYADFQARVVHWAQMVPTILAHSGELLPIVLEIANEGDRAADRVLLEVEISGGFTLQPMSMQGDGLAEFLRPPPEPRPRSHVLDPLQQHLSMEYRAPKRVDAFYPQDTPARDGSVSRITWRCEEFRQGAVTQLELLVVAKRPAARGVLTVKLGSATIAKATEVSAPLLAAGASKQPICAYVLRRASALPAKYVDVVRDRLASIHGCPRNRTHDSHSA
jgi:hypothetical protein